MQRAGRNRSWIWFFLVLGMLAGSAVAIAWVYNLRQQLTPVELKRNRDLWTRTGPRNYLLEFSKTVGKAGTASSQEVFVVTVRNGKVKSVVMKQASDPVGKPLVRDDPESSSQELLDHYDMNGIFDWLEEFLTEDARPGQQRAFNRGIFDPRDGHLIDYVRNVSGGQRVEIRVTRFEPESP